MVFSRQAAGYISRCRMYSDIPAGRWVPVYAAPVEWWALILLVGAYTQRRFMLTAVFVLCRYNAAGQWTGGVRHTLNYVRVLDFINDE